MRTEHPTLHVQLGERSFACMQIVFELIAISGIQRAVLLVWTVVIYKWTVSVVLTVGVTVSLLFYFLCFIMKHCDFYL